MSDSAKRACVAILASWLAWGCSDNPAATSDTVTGVAQVRSVSLALLESFPVQLHATAVGYLADPCTSIGEITQRREGERIAVTIGTTRPADAVCATVLVDFEEVVPVDVLGLPAGTYTVDVNGVLATFTLTVDNTPLS